MPVVQLRLNVNRVAPVRFVSMQLRAASVGVAGAGASGTAARVPLADEIEGPPRESAVAARANAQFSHAASVASVAFAMAAADAELSADDLGLGLDDDDGMWWVDANGRRRPLGTGTGE